MSNQKENLIPAAHKLTVEEQSAGGKASGAARRERADLKKELQNLLDSDFKVKGRKKMSGAAAIAFNLISTAIDPENRAAVSAIKLIFETIGNNNGIDEPVIIVIGDREEKGENNNENY